MNSGWVKLHRCLLDDPVWKQATHPQRSVLITALLLANHTANQWTWKGKKYFCEPGQFITSVRGLADKAGVTVKVARCAMERLRNLDFWALDTAQEGTMVTICNWNKYQNTGTGQGHSERQARGTGGAHNKNDKNKEKNTMCKTAASSDAVQAQRKNGKSFDQESFDRFWDAFLDKRGKAPALRAWKAIKDMSPELTEQIIAGAKLYAKQRPALLAKGSSPKMAQGWLTDRRWEDEGGAHVVLPPLQSCADCRHNCPGGCPQPGTACHSWAARS